MNEKLQRLAIGQTILETHKSDDVVRWEKHRVGFRTVSRLPGEEVSCYFCRYHLPNDRCTFVIGSGITRNKTCDLGTQ